MDTSAFQFQNVAVAFGPFLAFFLGIIIRKFAWPSQDSPPLGRQFLVGIPVSLVVVAPLLPVLSSTKSDLSGFLLTLGIIMEHGMLVMETAAKRLKKAGANTPDGE